MNKKSAIAFKFFNSIENNFEYDFEEIIESFLELRPKNKNDVQNDSKRIRNEIIRYFDYLYGLKQTLPIFIKWIVECKKIDIPNNSIFRYHNKEWMRIQGLSWTEILSREGVQKPIKWVYKDNQLVEIDS
jgi:hypothetical protein